MQSSNLYDSEEFILVIIYIVTIILLDTTQLFYFIMLYRFLE